MPLTELGYAIRSSGPLTQVVQGVTDQSNKKNEKQEVSIGVGKMERGCAEKGKAQVRDDWKGTS